jgi:penicillin-binding protein 1C
MAAAELALRWVPLPAGLFAAPPPGLQLTDCHGQPLRALPDEQRRFHGRLVLADASDLFVNATLAAEDKRFWKHAGVDWLATARAAKDWLTQGRVVSGASTITQQLIKNAEPRPRTLRTKWIEAAQALRLERLWSKQQILEEYLNRIDYGNLCRGAATAARFYFDKPLASLSPAEAALLAALPNGPARLNPVRHPERARQRQQVVLSRMRCNGWLTEAEFQRALSEPVKFDFARRVFAAPHFVDLLLAQSDLGRHRGAVATTLDLELNRFAERAVRGQIERLRDRRVNHGAVVVIDNHTGGLLAMIGSGDFFAPGDGQVNGAWAPRSAGSTFKPFTYLLAMEHGDTPATVVADVPVEFATVTGVFRPENYDRHFHGPVRSRIALANSLNVAAVRVLERAGGAEVLRQALRDCGLTTLEKGSAHYGLGLTIGNAEARLLELTNAYACLARLGEHRPVRLVAGEPAAAARRVFDAGAAFLVADMLADNLARTAAFGAESGLRFDFPVACKTGTSSDFRDNWAFGYTPEFTVGVWVGNFNGAPMERVSGVTGAAPLLHEIFTHLCATRGTSWYAMPAEVVERTVHPLTGKLLADGRRDGVREKFLARALPLLESAEDYDARGCVKLPLEYGPWLASRDNWLGDRVVLATETVAAESERLSPLPGSVFYLDPDLPASSHRLPLRSAFRAAHWESSSLSIETDGSGPFVRLLPGRHTLRVTDPAGRAQETWFEVRAL